VDGLGTELPQRHTYVRVLLLMTLFFAVPVVSTAVEAMRESGWAAAGGWAMTVVMVLLLVVVPLLIARSITSRHTYVSDEAVSVVSGGELRQLLAFDDLTEVKVRYTGNGGNLMPKEKIFLSGPMRTGRGSILVSRLYVESLQPLLRRLEAEVADRPELLRSGLERDYFEQAVRSAR
jgi:hypothetical protein